MARRRSSGTNEDFSAPSGFGQPSATFNTLLDDDPENLPTMHGPGSPSIPGHSRDELQKVEAGYDAKIAKDKAVQDQTVATYGTHDKAKVQALVALGVFDKDIKDQYVIDPEGTKLKFDQAMTLLGRDGTNAALPPEQSMRERQYRVGTGAGGERYFTNLSNKELSDQEQDTKTITGAPRRGANPKDLQDLNMHDTSRTQDAANPPAPANMAEAAFEGKVSQLRSLMGKEDRSYKHATDLNKYVDELMTTGKAIGANKVRDKLQQDLYGGELQKRGITPAESNAIDKMIVDRARNAKEIHKKKLNPDYYLPWDVVHPNAPDPAQPESVANPGGGVTPQGMVMAKAVKSDTEHQAMLDSTQQQEIPRTLKWANAHKEQGSGKLDEDLGNVGKTQSQIGRFAETLNMNRKERQAQSEIEPYDPETKSDIYKLFHGDEKPPKLTEKERNQERWKHRGDKTNKRGTSIQVQRNPRGNEGDLGGDDRGARAADDLIARIFGVGRTVQRGMRRIADGSEYR